MYSNVEALRQALVPGGEVSDKSTAASMDDATLLPVLEEASRAVDTYLGRRYALPLASPVPDAVDDWAKNIAAYLATLTFRRGKDLPDTDPVVRRYKMTIEALVSIRDGKADIPDVAVVAPIVGGGTPAVLNPIGVDLAGQVYDPYYGRDGMHYDYRIRDGYGW